MARPWPWPWPLPWPWLQGNDFGPLAGGRGAPRGGRNVPNPDAWRSRTSQKMTGLTWGSQPTNFMPEIFPLAPTIALIIFRWVVRSLRCCSSLSAHVSHPYRTDAPTVLLNNFIRDFKGYLRLSSSSLRALKIAQARDIR